MRYVVQPGGVLTGRLRVPGDKSISHRALLLGAIAEGRTEISGFLSGEDCLATLQALRALGVVIEGPRAGEVVVHGVGLRGLRAPQEALDLGNSGTSMRLLAGLSSAQAFASTLTGDASLMRRPMRRVSEPLTAMGARIETSPQGTPPLRIEPAAQLTGIDYALPVASAQVKSAILLAGLYAEGTTCVREPAPSRDHTERMLEGFGYPLERQPGRVRLRGGAGLRGQKVAVPADISSGAFFLVGATIAAGSELFVEALGINPTRAGAIETLRRMGADIELDNERRLGAEPIADVRVRSAALVGTDIAPEAVPAMIDELPALCIAAACARGTTVLTGAAELRVKESDRIQTMVDGLRACGIRAEPRADGLVIEGGQLSGGHIDSHGDHRVAMAFAVAGLAATGEIAIAGCDNVATSFPDFAGRAREAGLRLASEDSA